MEKNQDQNDTPELWHVSERRDGLYIVRDSDGWPIGNFFTEEKAKIGAAAPALLAALQGLFEHCAMIHMYWGDNSNAKEADAAIDKARAAIAQARGE